MARGSYVHASPQVEEHTRLWKRRSYPDGTVKILHCDGRQETRYAGGRSEFHLPHNLTLYFPPIYSSHHLPSPRVRIKDKQGSLLTDTTSAAT